MNALLCQNEQNKKYNSGYKVCNAKLITALHSLVRHTVNCEEQLDREAGMGDDSGAECSQVVLEAQRVLKEANGK